MKHVKLFENWLNENNHESLLIKDWLDSVENFVNTVRDEELAGNISGFPDKESTQALAKLVYGEYYDLVRPAEISPEAGYECLSWKLGVSKPGADVLDYRVDEESPENMWGTFVSPQVEDRMMKSYEKMLIARKRLGSELISHLNQLMDEDGAIELLNKDEDGHFMWDSNHPKYSNSGECTPSILRSFIKDNLERY